MDSRSSLRSQRPVFGRPGSLCAIHQNCCHHVLPSFGGLFYTRDISKEDGCDLFDRGATEHRQQRWTTQALDEPGSRIRIRENSGPWSNGMTAESHSANRGSIPRGSTSLRVMSVSPTDAAALERARRCVGQNDLDLQQVSTLRVVPISVFCCLIEGSNQFFRAWLEVQLDFVARRRISFL